MQIARRGWSCVQLRPLVIGWKVRGMLRQTLLALGLVVAAGTCTAQSYPVKPVRLVIPYAPGGPVDGVARVLVPSLNKMWGHPIVIENRGGAAGNIGTDAVVRSSADGHTLLFTASGPLVINQALYGNMPYDPVRDLAPVTIAYSTPNMLIVSATLPVNSVQELIAYAKKRPGKTNYSSGGVATPPHLAGELFKLEAGLDSVHIAYKGGQDMVTAVISGDATFCFNSPRVMPLVQAGKLKALAMSSIKRFSLFPEVPTVAESGLPGFDVVSWGGMLAPAQTPREIISRLHADVTKALFEAENKPRFDGLGVETVGNKPEEFAAKIKSESAHWVRVVKAANIKPE
jgi:tripartite-type tricarboxylate transporter receptor subunit TctC